MKDIVIRELAAMGFLEGPEGGAAQAYALERLPRRELKKYIAYLKKEMSKRRVTVRTPDAPDDDLKKTINDIFPGGVIRYETVPGLGAGMELEHDDNIARMSVKSIIDRAILGIKESL